MQLSYNKLKIFHECALKYRLSYIERHPRPPIAALAFQRLLHRALANYHFLAKRDGVVREDDLLQSYAQSWDVSHSPEVKDTKGYREGEAILRRYCRAENEKARVPAYLEHSLEVAVGPYMLTGKIDRIDFSDTNRYSIVDYKLDRRVPEANAADTSNQLSFYALLVREGLGAPIEDVRLYYLRHGVEQVSVPDETRMRQTIDWIDATANAIHKEKSWEPCAGPACVTCAFHTVCPEKTGRPRPNRGVWQQGNLLWEMSDEPDPELPEPGSSQTSGTVRQLSFEDY